MTTKQEKLLELIKKKKECDKRALEIVLKLIETGVDKKYLLENALYIGTSHFDDVIEERKITGICGWALCDNKLDPALEKKPQKYVIRGKRVLDITNRKSFCSAKCYAKATHFNKQLLTSPLWMRDEDSDDEEHVEFVILDDDVELHGLKVNITGLKIDDDKSENDSSSDTDDIKPAVPKSSTSPL